MAHGSSYGKSAVVIQERQHRPTSSTYSIGSSASRSSGSSTGYYTSTMDSSSSTSRSSSVGTDNRDYTGTYRSSDANGYNIDAKHNTKGPREVVIVQHNTKSTYDPAEPRSSDRYRN